MAGFRHFPHLARLVLLARHGGRMVRTARTGSKTMTFINAQQLAVSLIAALVTSAVFVSAAIGPVVQLA
jgi:hypothetical protein